MNKKFAKRVFSPRSMFELLGELIRSSPSIPGTLTSGRVSDAFRERILLAVTSVNRCRYCQWMHTDLAEASGISQEQINLLLGSETGDVPDYEKPALVYALHYANTNRQPAAAERDKLYAIYGEEIARDIENFIKLIFFANLSGNTFDSLLSRFRGEPHPEGNVMFELFFAACSAPVLLAIAAGTKKSVNPLKTLEHEG